MTRNIRALILSGVVGIAGVLGSGATTAKAQGYGLYGPGRGFGPGIAVGEPYGHGRHGHGHGGYGHGYRGYGRGYRGYGRGYGGYRPGPFYGGGYGGSSYYYSETTTTIVHCTHCGGYHDSHSPCGGGYRPGPYPW